MKAKLAFAYGWTDDYIESMPYKVMLDYWKALTPIEAERAVLSCKISQFPDLKASAQRKFFNGLVSEAKKINEDEHKEALTTKEIALNLARKLGRG